MPKCEPKYVLQHERSSASRLVRDETSLPGISDPELNPSGPELVRALLYSGTVTTVGSACLAAPAVSWLLGATIMVLGGVTTAVIGWRIIQKLFDGPWYHQCSACDHYQGVLAEERSKVRLLSESMTEDCCSRLLEDKKSP